ncbi:MAG: hypothetical protein JSS96_17295, partial [Bacteroidetes bacterium]|nr:hypothetical protein [Bacteroidota bacterium]
GTIVTTVCSKDGDAYRYGFNGKLKDNEWSGIGNSLDYSARMEDTRTGRFRSIDPLAKKYPFNSPYDFAAGSPISFIDENGKGPILTITNNNLANKAMVSMSNHNLVEFANIIYTAIATNTLVKNPNSGEITKVPNVINNGDAGRGLTKIDFNTKNGEKTIGILFDPLKLNATESKNITPKDYAIKVISTAISSIDKKIADVNNKIEKNERTWRIQEKVDKEQPGDPANGMAAVKIIHYYEYSSNKEDLTKEKAEYEAAKNGLEQKKDYLEKSK